jgi:glycerophosphoryl diester phosphodiesterase
MALNFAHRGASGEYPENTMLAFEKAVEMGCDGIETDVQLTKDGVLVLCHDELLDRTTDGTGLLAERTYEELNKLNAAAQWEGKYSNIKIPTLDELLEFSRDKSILVNLEIKNSVIDYKNIEKMIIDKIYNYKIQDRVIISSFNHYSIARCRAIDSSIKLGVLYCSKLYEPWNYAKQVGADALHPLFYTLDEQDIKAIKKAKLSINTYTVNEEKYMRQLIALGIDGIITNYPDKLKKVIEEMK